MPEKTDTRDEKDLLFQFVEMAILFGQNYLSCGGPTSRLENRLVRAASSFNIQCEVFAIPTGVFVSAKSLNANENVTLNGRVRGVTYNLHQLVRLEKLLSHLEQRKTGLSEAIASLREESSKSNDYPRWIQELSPLFIGIFASLPLTPVPAKSLLCGAVTWVIAKIHDVLDEKIKLNKTFCDFFASLLAFALSAVLSQPFGLPPEILVFGSLLFMVPGLTLTTAVSELADQNFVSGTTKLFHGALTLLSMGLAYLLFQELLTSFAFEKIALVELVAPAVGLPFWLNALSLAFVVMGFSIEFNVPKRHLALATAIGMTSWGVLEFIGPAKYLVASSFASSFAVGFLSLLFGRWLKLPSQIFSVPGILSLVPGMLSFSIFGHLMQARVENVPPVLVQAVLTSGAIVFGLLASRVPFLLRDPNEDV